MRTASSDLPDSGTQDNRSYTAIRDISGETDLGCAANPLLQCPALLSSTCDGTQPGLLPFPRSVHASRDILYILQPRITFAFQGMLSHQSSLEKAQSHPFFRTSLARRSQRCRGGGLRAAAER